MTSQPSAETRDAVGTLLRAVQGLGQQPSGRTRTEAACAHRGTPKGLDTHGERELRTGFSGPKRPPDSALDIRPKRRIPNAEFKWKGRSGRMAVRGEVRAREAMDGLRDSGESPQGGAAHDCGGFDPSASSRGRRTSTVERAPASRGSSRLEAVGPAWRSRPRSRASARSGCGRATRSCR